VKVIVAGGVDSGCPQGIRTELSTAVTMVWDKTPVGISFQLFIINW
jgi:hypothetical protein